MSVSLPLNEVADRDCLDRIARGEEVALQRLYEIHGSRVFGFARRMLGDAHEAEEATQDVFVRAWRRAADYDQRRASPWGWLVMMTRSVCLDRLRRRRRRREFAAGDDTDLESSGAAAETNSDGAAADLPELLVHLRPVERACIAHVFLDGLSQTETAARTGLPLGSVKTHVRRALQRLRESLTPHDS